MKPRWRDDRRTRATPLRPYGAACQAPACRLPDRCGTRRMLTARDLPPLSPSARVCAADDLILAWEMKGQGTFGSLAPAFLAAVGRGAAPRFSPIHLVFSISGCDTRLTQQIHRPARG